MKKYLLGIFILALAIGLYSFTIMGNDKNQDPTFYWYLVDSGLGGQADFENDDVSYISGPSTVANAPTGGCPASSDYKCVVGFRADQINTTSHVLNAGEQTPPATKSKRTTP